MPTVLKPDPFSAVLLSSPPLSVTDEQRNMIREILDIACSDSRFAEKAYAAIVRVLTGGVVVPPVVLSLNPPSAVLGSPDFTLRVMGTGFTPASIIVFNGSEEPTTFVSPAELTTGVNMATAIVATDVPVAVLNADGVLSDAMTFSFTDVAAQTAAQSTTKNTAPIQTAVKK